MPIINKTKNTAAIFNRGREVVKVYDHGKLAWQKSIPDYLCFTALEAGQFTLTIPAAVTATYLSYVEWSKDGRTWNHTDNTSEAVTIDVQVASGEKVYWRGSGNATAMGTTVGTQNSQFSSTGNFDVSGNIMSLLFANNFEEQTSLPNVRYSFTALFRNCSKLISAENLLLPATTLQMECYRNLFLSCSNLVKGIKVLPAMRLMQNCYLQMYGNCSSLTEGTEIPATTAVSQCCYGMYTGCSSLTIPKPILFTNTASYCCYQMYRFCTSLEVAPDLTQATLADNCCRQMFKGCTKLKYIKCLATNISATQCLLDWCDGVSSTGTFIQASGVTWPRGASGIPTGWVDVEKRTMPQGYKQVLYVDNEHNSVQGAACMSIGYPVNMKYDTIEIAFQQDTISNGMPIQSAANVAGKAWFYNYLNSSMSSKPFSIYVSNESGAQRGMTVYQPLDTEPHVVRFAADGTHGTVTHNGTVVTTIYNVSDLPETCASNTILFGTLLYRGKIFYFKNWDKDSNVLADYVPSVRESDGKVGFYDFASNSYKTHTQAGDWTAGEEI